MMQARGNSSGLLSTDGDSWRAPRQRLRPLHVTVAALAVLILAAVVWAVVWIASDSNTPPPPTPVATGPKSLTTLETAGITALLNGQRNGPHAMNGTVAANGRSFGIQLSYIADGSTGSGTLTAGGLRGDILVDQGIIYLRGDQAFWSALGVSGTPPAPPGWTVLPPDFLGGKVFVTPGTWLAALAPTNTARLDGTTYFSGRGDASARVTDAGITHIRVFGINADIRTITPAEVTGPAALVGADHGPGVPLGRTPAGEWTLVPAAAPVVPPAPTTTSAPPAPPTQ